MKYVNIHLKGRSKAGLLMVLVIRIKANFPFKNKGGIVKKSNSTPGHTQK